MNKKMKVFSGAILASLTAASLAACSGGDSGKTELEFFSTKGENNKTYQKLISEFEKKNPKIDVKLVQPPDAGTVMKTRLTKNDIPDVMAIGGDSLYGELARAGVLKDVKGSDLIKDVQPSYLDMTAKLVGVEKNGVYGVPYAANANAVIYNKDKFKELGVEVPKTWDEFIAIAEEAKAHGETGFYFTLKDAWTGMVSWNSLGAALQGEDFAEKRSKGKASFTKNYDEAADKFQTLLKYGHKDNFGKTYNDGNTAFAQGKSVMYLQGVWAIPEIVKANPDINLGIFPMPVTNNPEENKLVSGVDVMLAIDEESDHQKEAEKFIQFLLEKENVQTYVDEQSAFSAIKDVYQEDPKLEGIKENFEKGTITSFPDHYYPQGMNAANILQEFLIGKKTNKEEFLKKMDKEWDKVEERK
ncbi:ABC transporter substrate-binding protein [Fictibacillus aquaticus]|uniref:ABC transporter substrate-binding protein n=1 Tax=Fictibacillus aquaticus TaxID=2021314 RepID=A0A235F9S3_9BACL|nr:extracellular solute-binding protein [Fictibacillus aquaticus]OYD57707.1 ABC transporter substrate-binding protein [Fictibacillus aquaticus]